MYTIHIIYNYVGIYCISKILFGFQYGKSSYGHTVYGHFTTCNVLAQAYAWSIINIQSQYIILNYYVEPIDAQFMFRTVHFMNSCLLGNSTVLVPIMTAEVIPILAKTCM